MSVKLRYFVESVGVLVIASDGGAVGEGNLERFPAEPVKTPENEGEARKRGF